MAECHVLEGVFGLLVQGVLFLISIGVLAYKFKLDPAGRTPTQFILDSSKQIAGAGWTHVLNLMCAVVLHRATESGDQCAWYWIEIMVDTTLGVAVEYFLLQALVRAIGYISEEAAHEVTSGKYVDGEGNFRVGSYFRQLGAWLIVVTGMKLSMLGLLLVGRVPFQALAGFVLAPFLANEHLKLIMVMIVTPGVMNSLQFWLVDNIFVHAKSDDRYGSVLPNP